MIVAVDNGFGLTKVFPGKKVFPSILADFIVADYEMNFGKKDDTDQIISHGKDIYFVGDIARRQGNPKSNISSERLVSDEGLLFVLSGLVNSYKPGNHDIKLVVGLPVSDYNLKNKYSFKLKGLKRVLTYNLLGEVTGEYLFNISDISVIPQPLGTVFYGLLDDTGDIVNMDFTKKVGIIDIGFYTVDLARVDHLEFIQKDSMSFNDSGINLIYQEISKEIYRKFKKEVSIEKLDPILQSGVIHVLGEVHSIYQIGQDAITRAADKLISKIKTIWENLWELDLILITGGGAALMGESLKFKLEHSNVTNFEEDGIFTNCKGYYRYGKRKWKE
jgi:hypothetical protein